MVQQGFVREHRAWLIPIQEDDDGGTYVYDLSNPQLRSYLDGLMHRYLVEFDADGILLDMVGLLTPEGGALRGDPLDLSTLPQRDLAQTMDIYRFVWETATKYKPDVWIEGAWAAPPLARPYAQTWRYADEYPAFSYPYPFGGLVEHVTFAALQEQLLGRRSHVGFIWGPDDPETLSVQRQWLAAAVAMQRQTILSTDLASVSAETTQLYREYLAALQPFSADPIFGPGTPPEVFSTTVGGTTYLGLLNTAPDARTIAVDLVEHGLSPASTALTFDPETRAVTLAEADLVASVEPRSFRLLVLRTEPGVLWADRSWWTEWEGSTLIVHVDPSPAGAGRLWVYAPGAPSIQPGSRPDVASADRGFGLVTIDLPDGAGFEVRLTF
jgi:hypothetical protein